MNFYINKKKISYLILSLVILSFFLGFYFNENSAGAGGYNGDITWILQNIEIFKNNSFYEAITNQDFFGNRTPLIYILNDLLNPFFYEYENYRITTFLFSLTGPIFIYHCLKNKLPKLDHELALLISFLILLSPYYRTSAFWALNENYGLISSLISFLSLNLFLKNMITGKLKINFLLITILFSSLSVYFDLKLIIVTMICFFYIFFSTTNIKFKVNVLLIYVILGLPYLFLILEWNGLVPIKTQVFNENTVTSFSRIENLHLYHLGYCTTIVAFYLFPFLFLKEKSFFEIVKNLLNSKWLYLIISIPIIYLIYLNLTIEFRSYTIDNYWVGLGVVNKLSSIIFDDLLLRSVFTYITIFLSWIVICLYIENKFDFLIISFFYTMSLFLWPLLQEYFDPIIMILCLLIFKTKIAFNYNNVFFLFLYFSIFLTIANIYYLNTV